ncbi:hypothetical protein [Mesorhizobium onobrychidis]|uniref:Helix-turn-helix domain-containing protein n=1 Tax=Mesorhizobium onobrychidis TaxID=2775404 RepID=A0ABY5QQT7_9HYPH|nr:hypothetical protein [Mesorhizobium onobrychidis]UVC12842.1 hypothetical protein IHQ72_18900 [Mesorhizobium onobrychidis]
MTDEAPSPVERASKASFKLDMIETVNADPQMQPSDLAVVAAHLCVMSWPERRAWLSTSKARAMTGLSERQIVNSRARIAKRGYLVQDGLYGTTKIFRLENDRLEDMRQHVVITTEYLKEIQKDRQTERRRLARVVHANSAETENACHAAQGDCDVPANSAGNIPSLPPQDIALKEEEPFREGAVPSNGYAAAKDDHLHIPFPAPTSEEELAETFSKLFADYELGPHAMARMCTLLATGRLTPAIVQGQRSDAA